MILSLNSAYNSHLFGAFQVYKHVFFYLSSLRSAFKSFRASCFLLEVNLISLIEASGTDFQAFGLWLGWSSQQAEVYSLYLSTCHTHLFCIVDGTEVVTIRVNGTRVGAIGGAAMERELALALVILHRLPFGHTLIHLNHNPEHQAYLAECSVFSIGHFGYCSTPWLSSIAKVHLHSTRQLALNSLHLISRSSISLGSSSTAPSQYPP